MHFFYSLTRDRIDLLATLAGDARTGFEIRLDSFEQAPDAPALRAATTRALMATFRSLPHLGSATTSARDERGWRWREQCLRAGFELIDVELDEPDLAGKIAAIQAGGARAVLSHHDLKGSEDDLDRALERALTSRADIIKIVGSGRAAADFASQRRRYRRSTGRALVHFYMGDDHRASRILSLLYGAPFTFLAAQQGAAVAPGQLTRAQLEDIYRPWEIDPADLRLFAVIGKPIGHSQSPAYHNGPLRRINRNALFVALPAESAGDLDLLLGTFPELRGLAVTKPMKEHAAKRATRLIDEGIANLAAVNTLVATADGWAATNTDFLAMIELLRPAAPGTRVRVLGFGGLGKAVVRACALLGLETEVCNRTPARLQGLESARSLPWQERHREGAAILVQATSVGMAPAAQASPMDHLPKSVTLLIETIYDPAETRLLAMARAGGVRTLDGSALFTGQATLQSQIFCRSATESDAPS